MATDTMIMAVHVDDGYLLGGEDGTDGIAFRDKFWHPADRQCCEDGWCTIEGWKIPVDKFQPFYLQGSTDQVYDDGYQAYRELRACGEKLDLPALRSFLRQ